MLQEREAIDGTGGAQDHGQGRQREAGTPPADGAGAGAASPARAARSAIAFSGFLRWPSRTPGSLALDVALLEAVVEFFQERRLLGAELDHLLGVLALERQPALVARAQALVVEDLLNRGRPPRAAWSSGGSWRSAAGPSARPGPRAESAASSRRSWSGRSRRAGRPR